MPPSSAAREFGFESSSLSTGSGQVCGRINTRVFFLYIYLPRWHDKCSNLRQEDAGAGKFYKWKDLLPIRQLVDPAGGDTWHLSRQYYGLTLASQPPSRPAFPITAWYCTGKEAQPTDHY